MIRSLIKVNAAFRLATGLAAVIGVVGALGTSPAMASVRLPAIIGDHMVLQRDMADPIWGWANPGESVKVTASVASETSIANHDGRWSVKLAALGTSTSPIDVTVTGSDNTITVHDVLVGDVWVASGQSNMEFQLRAAATAKTEVPLSNLPNIRLFLVPHMLSLKPLTDCKGHWVPCSPQSAAGFSAVGYYFAKNISEAQHVPVGMIGTYWGGTPIGSWMPPATFASNPDFKGEASRYAQLQSDHVALQAVHDRWQKDYGNQYLKELRAFSNTQSGSGKPATRPTSRPMPGKPEPLDPSSPYQPGVLYNGMVLPLQPFAIKGVIWYQGEANVAEAAHYRKMLPGLIDSWRNTWGEPEFPFLFVQLPNFATRATQPSDSAWARLREAQLMTVENTHNTGMPITIDLGSAVTIHPLDKLNVAHRLALVAEHVAYGNDRQVYTGPIYDSFKVDGHSIRIHFKDVDGGLMIGSAPNPQPGEPPAAPATELHGFAIAGVNHRWTWAEAVIDGNELVVSSNKVPDPVAVRYGWGDNPDANLYNHEELPASPFRTDDWGLNR